MSKIMWKSLKFFTNTYSDSPSSRQTCGRIALLTTEVGHGHVTCSGQWNETECDACHFYVEALNCQC